MKNKIAGIALTVFAAILNPANAFTSGWNAVSNTSAADTEIYPDYVVIPVGSKPEAVDIGDLNNDGRKDLALTTSAAPIPDPENDFQVFVYLQTEDGLVFSQKCAAGGRPLSVDIGDVNGDGKNDIVAGNHLENISVFLQNAGGTFDAPAVYPTENASKVRIGDLNGDGRFDVAGIGVSSQQLDIFLQSETGDLVFSRSYPVNYGSVNSLDVGDVDGDKLSDVVILNGSGEDTLAVLTQDPGTGALNDAVYYDTGVDNKVLKDVSIGDLNGDKFGDIIVVQTHSGLNAKLYSFLQDPENHDLEAPVSYPSNDVPQAVKAAHVNLNSDRFKDVVVLHSGDESAVGVYLQDVEGHLSPEQIYPTLMAAEFNPSALAVGDLNGDRMRDLAIANPDAAGLVVHFNALRFQTNETPMEKE